MFMRFRYLAKKKKAKTMVSLVSKAKNDELNELIHAVIHRYRILHPGWEVLFYSLHREGDERSADIVRLIRTLEAEMNAKKDSLG